MNKASFFIFLICFQFNSLAQIIDSKEFSIGESIEFKSQILDENRTINVYLPNSYQTDIEKDYPVIYLLDGSRDEDFIHIAGLVQFCSFSWIEIIQESIVVGIGNIDRKRDFTYPSNNAKDKKEFPTTGGSEKFIAFLELELQNLIKKKYRVNEERTIIGQSLGGLLAAEILFKKPDIFENYIIISPSLWWDDETLLKYELKDSVKEKSIYIGVGKEGEIMERVAAELHEKIKLKKGDSSNLFYGFFKEQDHGDVLHLAVYDSFENIFKKKK